MTGNADKTKAFDPLDMENRMRLLVYIGSCVVLSACMNTDAVNVIMSNKTDADLLDREVRLPLEEVRERMHPAASDTLILLNEKNLPVAYRLSADGECIVFSVSVKSKSQKTYSVNKRMPGLSDSFMTFRRSNICLALE